MEPKTFIALTDAEILLLSRATKYFYRFIGEGTDLHEESFVLWQKMKEKSRQAVARQIVEGMRT